MDCILRVIKGPDTGQEYKLTQGPNVIGRADHAAVRLTVPEISWEHAVVTRSGEDYVLANLSAHGTVMNGQKVAGQIKIRPRDQFQVGDETVLRMDSADGSSGQSALLMWGLLLGLLVAVGVMVYSAATEDSGVDDWDRAYKLVEDHMKMEVGRGNLPREAIPLFQNAWRLDQAGDYKTASSLWFKVQVVVLESPAGRRASAMLPGNPRALTGLLRPGRVDIEPSADEAAAAMLQFVNRRAAFAAQKAYPSKKKQDS